jgi:hypothetical protein
MPAQRRSSRLQKQQQLPSTPRVQAINKKVCPGAPRKAPRKNVQNHVVIPHSRKRCLFSPEPVAQTQEAFQNMHEEAMQEIQLAENVMRFSLLADTRSVLLLNDFIEVLNEFIVCPKDNFAKGRLYNRAWTTEMHLFSSLKNQF